MRRQVPASVANALRVLVAIVLVSAVTALLTWVQRDEVILSWAKGNPTAQELLASGGIELLREGAIVPKFVPLAVVSFVVFLLLAVVLAAFLVDGHGWSRLMLTLMAFFGVLVSALGLLNHLPTLFVALAVLDGALRRPGVLPLAQGHQRLPARALRFSSALRIRLLTRCRWGRVPLALFEHLFGRGLGGGDLDPHRHRGRWRGRRAVRRHA